MIRYSPHFSWMSKMSAVKLDRATMLLGADCPTITSHLLFQGSQPKYPLRRLENKEVGQLQAYMSWRAKHDAHQSQWHNINQMWKWPRRYFNWNTWYWPCSSLKFSMCYETTSQRNACPWTSLKLCETGDWKNMKVTNIISAERQNEWQATRIQRGNRRKRKQGRDGWYMMHLTRERNENFKVFVSQQRLWPCFLTAAFLERKWNAWAPKNVLRAALAHMTPGSGWSTMKTYK